MIEKTYDFRRIVDSMTSEEIEEATRGMELYDLLELAHAGADYTLKQTEDAIANAAGVREAIADERNKILKRLRELGEERARHVADVLHSEWFYGEKK